MLKAIERNLSREQKTELERFGRIIMGLGASFAVCDAGGRLLLACNSNTVETNWQSAINSCLNDLKKYKEKVDEQPFLIDKKIVAASLKSTSHLPAHIALIDMDAKLQMQNGKSLVRNKKHSFEIEECSLVEVFTEMLKLLAERFNSETKIEEQAEMFSAELSQVYEELALIHKLSTNMKISNSDSNYLQMACDCLRDVVSVEGIVALLEKNIDDERRLVLTAGAGLIDLDEQMKETLHSRLIKEIETGNEALLDSEVDSPFKYDWPDYIKNIIVVPLYGKDRFDSGMPQTAHNENCIIGLMVAINRIGKPDFNSVDAKLFNLVANGCAVFVENGRLFTDLKELFIGSLKALTSSIDAKDRYTRGHSERVAFISQWIAERYAEYEHLEKEQINNIYLSGLLHDIGKIGITEAVLCKNGKLTEQELNCIRKHPAVGANILREIKQMHNIVPGVLCHHERMDGKGYPNGLTGEQIPLAGKILGLADSFDAMTSARVYRKALSLEQALDEVKKGLGTQFDEKVGQIFLNSSVCQLWDMIRDGLVKAYGTKDFSEYGTEAVGTLVK